MAQKSLSIPLSGVASRHDVQAIKDGLDTLKGVKSVSVSADGIVAVDYDSTGVTSEEIMGKLKKMGFSSPE